jgi:hypothetical protein
MTTQTPAFSRRWVRFACAAAGCYALLAVTAWQAVPWAVRRGLREVPKRLPGFEARITDARFDPFRLALTVRGFTLTQEKLGELAACDEFYASLQPLQLLRLAIGLRTLRLTRPRLIAAIAADGTSALDYLPKAPAGSAPAEPAKAAFIPRLVVRRLALVNAALEFESRLAKAPQRIVLDPINLELENLSTLPNAQGSYELSGRTDRGESLSWNGKLTVRPARLKGSISALGVDMSRVTDLPSSPVIVSSGRFDASMDYELAFIDGILAGTLSDAKASVHDLLWNLRTSTAAPRGPFTLAAGPARMELRVPLPPPPDAKATLNVESSFAGGWVNLEAFASFKPMEVTAKVKVAHLALAPFSPLAPPPTEIVIDSGTVSLEARVSMSSGGADAAAEAAFSLDGFSLSDRASRRPLMKLKRFAVEGARASTKTRAASIELVRLNQPFLRLFRGKNGRTNIEDALGVSFSSAPAEPAPAAVPAEPTPLSRGNPWLAKLKRFDMKDGRVIVQDEGVAPPFALTVQGVSASLAGLSTDGRSTATFTSSGLVEKAPFLVSGGVRASSAAVWADMTLKCDGIQLPAFSPYSIQMIGYKLDQGTLKLDLAENLAGRLIDTRNKVVVDQLALGEKVPSPTALNVPVKLGLAVLKDRNGVINLDVPIAGSLDDPQFRLLPVVLKTVLNVIVKAATSPFDALGAMMGGGADLGRVGFAAGESALTPAATANLDKVVKALADRPALKIGVRGASSRLDALAFGDRELRRQLRGSEPGDAALSASEEKKVLVMHEKAFGSAAASVAEARAKLDERLVPGGADLRGLALARAAAIQDYLTSAGVIADRFFKQEPSADAVATELQLDAR